MPHERNTGFWRTLPGGDGVWPCDLKVASGPGVPLNQRPLVTTYLLEGFGGGIGGSGGYFGETVVVPSVPLPHNRQSH